MRRLIVATFLPLDGVTQGPGGPGAGNRLFADGTILAGLKLADSKVSSTGVVIGTCEPAGEVVTRTFAPD